ALHTRAERCCIESDPRRSPRPDAGSTPSQWGEEARWHREPRRVWCSELAGDLPPRPTGDYLGSTSSGAPMATTLKLPQELKERVRSAAQEAGISPHAFMIAAIEQQTRLAEKRAE